MPTTTERGYGWHHQRTRAQLRPVIAAGLGVCAEPVCLMPTRAIPAAWAHTRLWHVSHDASSGQVIGPSHRRCNLAENARRNNPRRGRPTRWVL